MMTSRFARSSDPTDDSRLVTKAIARAKEGDMGALHFLYVRFADDVCGYVQQHRSRLPRGRGHHAERLRQADDSDPQVRAREVPFAAWILRVARNAALDHMRARRQIPFEEVRVDDNGHEQIGFERSQCLRDALSRLPEEQREVLVLRHIAGLSPSEIASRLGKTEGSIHGLHHRGRGALQHALREMDAAPGSPRASASRSRCRRATSRKLRRASPVRACGSCSGGAIRRS